MISGKFDLVLDSNFLSRDETMNKRVLDDLPFIQLDNMFIDITSQA